MDCTKLITEYLINEMIYRLMEQSVVSQKSIKWHEHLERLITQPPDELAAEVESDVFEGRSEYLQGLRRDSSQYLIINIEEILATYME